MDAAASGNAILAGLVGLVPVAELMAELAGSRHGATTMALEVLRTGTAAIGRRNDDIASALGHELVTTGVVTGVGSPIPGRAAELVTVCELLAASSLPSPAPPPDPRLVLSVPPGTAPLLDRERLDSLVLDVIRRATVSLDIGGAFWNEAGFEMLDEVLLPAVRIRHVRTTIYVNSPVDEHRGLLERRLGRFLSADPVKVRWFTGPRPTNAPRQVRCERP